MFLTDLIKLTLKVLFGFQIKCQHESITPDMKEGYCLDCGRLIRNEWYITRCSCCGVKMKAMVKNGEIVPQHHYCANCGSEKFNIEKLENINFIDINFAALVKKEVKEYAHPLTTRCWQEKTSEQPKLLVQYL